MTIWETERVTIETGHGQTIRHTDRKCPTIRHNIEGFDIMDVIFKNDVVIVHHDDDEYYITYPGLYPDRPMLVTSDRDEAIRSAKDRLLYSYIIRQSEEDQDVDGQHHTQRKLS